MATKTRRTSNSAQGDTAEALYNKDGEGQTDLSLIEEMGLDEVRELLRSTDWSTVADKPKHPRSAPELKFNITLPDKDFDSLVERLHAMEQALKDSSRGQESQREPKTLSFTRETLERYTAHRTKGLALKSQDWIRRADEALWSVTAGVVSEESMTALRDYTLATYSSVESHKKILSFAAAFLKFLSKTTFNQQFQAYTVFLELPKAVKVRKAVTGRIVTIDDIRNVLAYIKRAYDEGRINEHRYRYYTAFMIFGAFTGQRSESTIAQVTVGQLRDALQMDKPVLRVEPEQDKIRLAHEVPLHPCAVEAVRPLIEDRKDEEKAFEYISFLQWTKRQKIPMFRFRGHFVLGDLRKFAEQYGDIIGWDSSNRAYILSHGVSGIDWAHYKHPLPEHVYDVYMRYWKDVTLKQEITQPSGGSPQTLSSPFFPPVHHQNRTFAKGLSKVLL